MKAGNSYFEALMIFMLILQYSLDNKWKYLFQDLNAGVKKIPPGTKTHEG